MTNTKDFAIARDKHWYRIPCRYAPDMLPVARWLAFYHTKAFADAKWAVHFVTPIERIDRVLRRDLLPDEDDHPRASDPYFRLTIGPLERLERSVLSARQRRIVFIPTTLVKLQVALEINDLYHESPLEDKLWEALCQERIAAERQFYVNEDKTSYCLDFALFCTRGIVDVECDGDTWHLRPGAVIEDNARDNFLTRLGWRILRFSSLALAKPNLPSTVEEIRETSSRLGGLELPNRVSRQFGLAPIVVEQLRLW